MKLPVDGGFQKRAETFDKLNLFSEDVCCLNPQLYKMWTHLLQALQTCGKINDKPSSCFQYFRISNFRVGKKLKNEVFYK